MNADQTALKIYEQFANGRGSEREAASALLPNLNESVRGLLREHILKALKEKYTCAREELDKDASIRWARSWLVNTLGKICTGDAEAEAVVRKHLDPAYEPAFWVRYWAFESLISTGAPDLLQRARAATQDDEPMIRMQAQAVLATLNGAQEDERQGARAEIEAALTAEVTAGPDGRVDPKEFEKVAGLKWAVLRALRVVPIPSMFDLIEEIVKKGQNDDVTYDAIVALSAAKPGSPHAVRAALTLSELITRLRPHPWFDGIRTAALKALGRLKVESAATLILEELTDDNPAVVREAALALRAVSGVRTATARVAEAASNAPPERADALARALRWMERDEVVEELETVMVSGRPEHQEAARRLLSEMGGAAAMQKLRARTASIALYGAEMEKAEEKIRNLFESTIDEARRGFKVAVMMDVSVFAIGLLLVAVSAGLVLYKSGDLSSWVGAGLTGGTGVLGVLYTILIARPREQVHEAVDHLMHLKVIFLAYLRQLHQVDQAYTRRLLDDRTLHTGEAGQYSRMVEATMCKAVEQMLVIRKKQPARDAGEERPAAERTAEAAAGNGKVKHEVAGAVR